MLACSVEVCCVHQGVATCRLHGGWSQEHPRQLHVWTVWAKANWQAPSHPDTDQETRRPLYVLLTHTHTRLTVLFLSRTTRVGRYQKGKTNLDFTEARDSEWQWHQLGLNQVCTLLHADNQASTPALIFYGPVALPFAQPTVLKYIFTVCSWIMPLISLCTYRAHTILSIRREN